MGKGATRKESNQPQTAQETGVGGGVQDLSLPDPLRVPLVELDPGVISKSDRGESVRLRKTASFEVHVKAGRLGNVPAYLEPAVAKLDPSGGKVEELSEVPPRAVVLLR